VVRVAAGRRFAAATALSEKSGAVAITAVELATAEHAATNLDMRRRCGARLPTASFGQGQDTSHAGWIQRQIASCQRGLPLYGRRKRLVKKPNNIFNTLSALA
jgi:hypothetical protein